MTLAKKSDSGQNICEVIKEEGIYIASSNVLVKGKRIGRVELPPPTLINDSSLSYRTKKDRNSFLYHVRQRRNIFKKNQFWLDNLEPETHENTSSFLQELKRRGTEGVNKVNNIGVVWGGSLVLQTVIGPGIFTSPKGVLQFGGSVGVSFIVWSWCGLISMLAALCFVELQLSVPRAGCEYGYIHKAFGRIPTFIYTWMRIALAEPVTTAVFTIAFADYVADTIFDNCGPADTIRKLIAVVAVVSLAVMNGIFRKLSKGLNVLAQIGKFVTLSTIIVCGLRDLCIGQSGILKEGFDHSTKDYDAIVMAIYNSLWAYGGWANVPHVTAGVRKPPRNMPMLILIVLPFVTVVYLLMVTSFFTVLNRQEMVSAEAIGVLWGQKMWGPFGFIIPVFVAFIALGNANGTFLSAGRTASVAVHDGYIPEILSYVHMKTKIHVPAVAARCIGTVALIFLTDVGSLLRFYVFTVWLFHGLTILGLVVMRWKKSTYYKPYKVPIVVPIIVVIFSLTIVVVPFTVGLPRKEFLFSVVVAALSVIGFLPFGKAKRLRKYWNWLVIVIQLLMNVIPPKIQTHKQSRSLRPTRKFAPASMKLNDTLYKPGRFSSTSTISQDSDDETPIRRVRFAEHTECQRKISTVSTFSTASSDYCEVMTDYDEATGEFENFNRTEFLQMRPNTSEQIGYDNGIINKRTSVLSSIHNERNLNINRMQSFLVPPILNERL